MQSMQSMLINPDLNLSKDRWHHCYCTRCFSWKPLYNVHYPLSAIETLLPSGPFAIVWFTPTITLRLMTSAHISRVIIETTYSICLGNCHLCSLSHFPDLINLSVVPPMKPRHQTLSLPIQYLHLHPRYASPCLQLGC